MDDQAELASDVLKSVGTHSLYTCHVNTNVKGKEMRRFRAAISELGIFFLTRKESKSGSKIAFMYSMIDLTEVCSDAGEVVFKNRKGRGRRVTPHAKNLASFLMYLDLAHRKLYFGSAVSEPLPFIGFHESVMSWSARIVDASPKLGLVPLMIRYDAACVKCHEKRDEWFVRGLDECEKNAGRIMVFDRKMMCGKRVEVMIWPLMFEARLVSMSFVGFAPGMVAKVMRRILKVNKNVVSVSFCGYNDYTFDKLRFGGISRPSVVSFTFLDVFGDGDGDGRRVIDLLRCLDGYEGSVKTLVLGGVVIKPDLVDELRKVVATSKCLNGLESLSLTAGSVNVSNEVGEPIHGIIAESTSVVQFMRLEKGRGFYDFGNNAFMAGRIKMLRFSCLSFLSVSTSVDFPACVQMINFSNCSFTGGSLGTIIKKIQEKVSRLTLLSFECAVIESETRDELGNVLRDMTPMNNLVELNWAGTAIFPSMWNDFRRVFLRPNLQMLTVSFGSILSDDDNDICKQFLETLAQSSLWGLWFVDLTQQGEYGGLESRLAEYVVMLESVVSLRHLSIRRQQVSTDIYKSLLDVCKKLPNLCSVDFDGLCIRDIDALYDFYGGLAEMNKLEMISPPAIDLRDGKASSEDYIRFGSLLKRKRLPPKSCVRAMYYERNSDMRKIDDFGDLFGEIPESERIVTERVPLIFTNHDGIECRSLFARTNEALSLVPSSAAVHATVVFPQAHVALVEKVNVRRREMVPRQFAKVMNIDELRSVIDSVHVDDAKAFAMTSDLDRRDAQSLTKLAGFCKSLFRRSAVMDTSISKIPIHPPISDCQRKKVFDVHRLCTKVVCPVRDARRSTVRPGSMHRCLDLEETGNVTGE